MNINRRDFLKFCTLSAASLGLSVGDLGLLQEAMANPAAPKVIWLQGSCCMGCSMSLLNRISTSAPQTADKLLTDSINLVYHTALMGPSGDSAAAQAYAAKASGNYILAVEGGVPTAFAGRACVTWEYKGRTYTFQDVVKDFAAGASKILCVGTCAAYGGMAAAPPNPTGVVSVKTLTGKSTINVAGCPAHPDWIAWTIVQLLIGANISLDSYGRPLSIYGQTVHSRCPRRESEEAERYGTNGQCLEEIGCKGPSTRANCPTLQWNNGVNWCVGANAPCYGCVNPTFPGTSLLP